MPGIKKVSLPPASPFTCTHHFYSRSLLFLFSPPRRCLSSRHDSSRYPLTFSQLFLLIYLSLSPSKVLHRGSEYHILYLSPPKTGLNLLVCSFSFLLLSFFSSICARSDPQLNVHYSLRFIYIYLFRPFQTHFISSSPCSSSNNHQRLFWLVLPQRFRVGTHFRGMPPIAAATCCTPYF